jgi:flagellar protein FliO/FliZ
MTSLLWFIAILVMIPVALWLFKRTPAGALLGGAASGGVMRSVAVLPMSASQRIVTIEVGHGDARRWLVLGVTPQSITTLHTMEPQGDAPGAAVQPMPGFAQLLGRLRNDKGSDKAADAKGSPGER